jgi:hypothetical protein
MLACSARGRVLTRYETAAVLGACANKLLPDGLQTLTTHLGHHQAGENGTDVLDLQGATGSAHFTAVDP